MVSIQWYPYGWIDAGVSMRLLRFIHNADSYDFSQSWLISYTPLCSFFLFLSLFPFSFYLFYVQVRFRSHLLDNILLQKMSLFHHHSTTVAPLPPHLPRRGNWFSPGGITGLDGGMGAGGVLLGRGKRRVERERKDGRRGQRKGERRVERREKTRRGKRIPFCTRGVGHVMCFHVLSRPYVTINYERKAERERSCNTPL